MIKSEGAVRRSLVIVIVDIIGGNDNGIDDIGNHVLLFVQISKFWTDFGAGDDYFLGVALVEYIDKRLIFGLGNSTNR